MNKKNYILLFLLITIKSFATNFPEVRLFDGFANESYCNELGCNSFGYIETNNQTKKKEFHFSDGSIGYLVSDDGKFYGVIDAANKIIVPQRYGKISCHGDLLYCTESSIGKKYSCALYKKDGQCKISESDGYTNLDFVYSKGKLIATSNNPKTVFDSKGDVLYKYKSCKDQNGFVYLINELTDTIVVRPGKYTGYFTISKDIIEMEIGEKKGIMELDGTVIVPAIKYGRITPSDSGFYVGLSKFGDGVEGYLDRNGKCIIPAENYSKVYSLKNGMFEVVAEDKASIADSLGNILFSTKYDELSPVKDKEGNWYYKTYLGNGIGKMSIDGKLISEPQPTIEKKEITKNGITYIEVCDKNGKYGVINDSGKQIIPCDYKMIMYDKDIPGFNLFKNGFQGVADLNGRIIIPCTKYHYVTVSYKSKYEKGFPLYYEVDSYGKCGLCDSLGNELIKPQFDDISPNINGTATAQLGLVKGIVDFSGNVIVPLEYTKISSLNNGAYEIESLGKKGICDNKGHIVIPPRYTSIKSISIKDSNFDQLYKVKDGETTGLYTIQGEMLFPTGLFKNVSIYKKGTVLSTDPMDNLDSKLMDMLKSVVGIGDSIDETKFDDKYIKAFNDFNDGVFYYYDLKGNLICDTSKEKDFDKNFDLGQKEFDKKNYKRAIEYYRQALTVKQDGVTYYNIGAAFYNLNKYKDAIKSLESCISLNPRQSVVDNARDLIIDCKSMLQQRRERKSDVAMSIFGSVLGVASSIMQTNAAIKSYNTAYDSNQSAYSSFEATSSSENNRTSASKTRQTNKCGLCNGTGKIEDSVANFGITDKKWCSECGEYRINGHYHKTCPSCKGKGYR